MNKIQVKSDLLQINDSINFIDSQFLKLKIAYHNIEEDNLDDIKQLIDVCNGNFNKLKTLSRDYIKEKIKEITKE